MPVFADDEELSLAQLHMLTGIKPGEYTDPTQDIILYTKQLVSIRGRLHNGAPYAITKPLPITYGQLKLLSQAIGFTLQGE